MRFMIQMRRFGLAAVAAVAITGCGLGEFAGQLGELADNLAAELEDEGTVLAAAAAVLYEADDAMVDLEADTDLDTVQTEMLGMGRREGQGPAMAPAGAPGRDGGKIVEQEIETGLLGRPLSAWLVSEYDTGPRSRVELDVAWVWSSGVSDTGDMNDALPVDRGGPHGWRRIDAESTTTWRTRDGGAVTSEERAMRRDHTDPAVQAFRMAATAVAPDHPRAPFRKLEWSGEFGMETTGSGALERRVELRDGGIDERAWAVSVSDGTLSIVYAHGGPDGLTADGEGTWDLGGTPRCPLDDVGSWTVVRAFPDEGTEPARPVSEVVTRDVDGLVAEVTGRLTLADGRALERSMTWTVESPTACDAPPTELRLAYEGVGYGGVARSGTIVRTADGLERTSVAEREDGTSVESVMTRSAAGASLVVRHLRTDGSTAALLELAAAPGGPAVGTLTRYDEAGEVLEVIEISRDPDGRFHWQRPGAVARVLLRGAF